jgi:hypothetical protein
VQVQRRKGEVELFKVSNRRTPGDPGIATNQAPYLLAQHPYDAGYDDRSRIDDLVRATPLDLAPASFARCLDRRHFASSLRRRQHAGRTTALDVYGVSAALRYSASEFGALEVQKIAQNPEQWRVVGACTE